MIVFFAFFGLSLQKKSAVAGFNDCIASVSLVTQNKSVECGGFVSGNVLFTVAHLFSYDDLYNCSSADTVRSSYFNIPDGLFISVNGNMLKGSYVYIDIPTDTALIFLVGYSYPEILCSETQNLRSSFFAPAGTDDSYLEINCSGTVYCEGNKLISLDFTARKGLSGYPVFDDSGYVNAIICSYDKITGNTYAVPAETLRYVLNNALGSLYTNMFL